MLRTRKISLTALLLAGVAMPQMSAAQDVDAEAEDKNVIVVTADRRAGSIQDTPIAVSALSGEDLARSAVYDTEALSYSAPGLVIQRDVVGKAVIRGIGTENFTIGGDPGVAVYNDGAYMARSSTAIFDFFDVERIEVLRGPQGTLYGRNAIGGVINVISKAPTNEFTARGSLTYGNYDALRFEGAVSGPITDSIRVRLAGLYSERDGFTKNIFPGISARGLDELDTKDLFALRGRIDFDITDNMTLELIGDIYRDDSNPPSFWYTDDTLPWQSPTSVFPRDLRTVSQGYEAQTPGISDLPVGQANRQDQTGITGRLTWESDFATLQLTTSYRETDFDWINDGDGLSDYLVVYFQRDQSEQFSQDIILTSNNDGPFEWIAGGTYLTEDSQGLYAIPLGPAFGSSTIVFQGTNETEAVGVFAEGTYNFGDFAVTAGLRYSDEKKDATLNFGQSAAGAPMAVPFDQVGTVPGGLFIPTVPPSFRNDAFTPRFVLEYNANDDLLLYASVTRGFKSGGFSLLDFPVNAFEPEFVWAYEVGAKAELFDNRLQLNTAAFFYDYTDQQLSQTTMLATQTTNAGSSTIWGFEAEFLAEITDQFTLNGNFAYLNTEFDVFCTQDSRDLTRPIDNSNCPGTPNLAGNRLPRSPEVQINLAATYADQINDTTDGFVRLEWQHTGDQFFSVFNRPNISEGAVNILNLSGGINFREGRFGIQGWARNLLDEEYFSNLFESGVLDNVVVPQGFVAPPRTYGLTLSFDY